MKQTKQNPRFKGKEIQMEGGAHQIKQSPSSMNESAYILWVADQKKKYGSDETQVVKMLETLSAELKHPFSGKELYEIISIIPVYSAVPILESVNQHYASTNNPDSVALYLGAGVDSEHTSLFLPAISVFVDYKDDYEFMDKNIGEYFSKLGYQTHSKRGKQHSILTLKKDGLTKKFIFVEENINHKERVVQTLHANQIESIDFLIQKKASGHPECALNYLDMLKKHGLLLYSDIEVYKKIPGMTQIWYGELLSTRLQDGGDPDKYPAKLFRKN